MLVKRQKFKLKTDQGKLIPCHILTVTTNCNQCRPENQKGIQPCLTYVRSELTKKLKNN